MRYILQIGEETIYMTRIGIIGAGSLGRYHALCWRALGVEVAAVYDVVPEAAQRMAAATGATACDSIVDVIGRVDVLDVITPPLAHHEATIAGLREGKPVICEKPIARNMEHALDMARTAKATGVPLFIAHVVRFWPQFAHIHDQIAAGAIGAPGIYRSGRLGSYPRWGSWFADEEMSGGVLVDVMIHDFDFARWCMGDVARLYVRRAHWPGPMEGKHSFAVLRFKSGAVGHIEGSWDRPPRQFQTYVEVVGDGGLLSVHSDAEKPIRASLHSGEPVVFETPLEQDPYLAELRHFMECIETGATPRVTVHDALAALQLSLAGMESAQTGRPVSIAPLEV